MLEMSTMNMPDEICANKASATGDENVTHFSCLPQDVAQINPPAG